MAKFPISPDDSASAIADALNYVLSGPGGLGQNFKGFSSIVNQDLDPPVNETAYLTGNFRPPFTQPTPAATYVPRIALSTSEYLDPRTIKFTFAATQSAPPFALGNGPYTIGITPSTYDDTYTGAGVVECTVDSVTVRITGDGTTPAAGTGGEIGFDAFGGQAFVSTDCNAKVVVNGATDRVFISAQLNNIFTYECTETSTLTYTVMINRRVAVPNNDPTNPEFIFAYDATISTRNYYMQVFPGTGTLPPPPPPANYIVDTEPFETIFTTVIDTPPIGYYWYLIELEVFTTAGDAVITQAEFSNRSLSAQVVKQ